MPFNVDAAKVVVAKKHEITPVVMDPCGVFRVTVDREAGVLVAANYVTAEAKEPSFAIRGVDAQAVMAEVLRLGLVSRLDHAGYLGGELAKAEAALRVGRDYVQDEALFGKCQ